MKMYIPSLGDVIELTANWTFQLYNEYRNETLLCVMGDTRKPEYYKGITSVPCTIPAGAKLKIDRIFIRKGAEEFNSVTFLLVGEKTAKHTGLDYWNMKVTKPSRPVRFWAKLEDVNGMEFEQVMQS